MNKEEMKACAYVTKRLDDAANEVYQEMYGEWKHNDFYYLGIKAPEYLVFMYQAQALLPKAYMNDELDAKPNALFKALKSNNFEKAKDIIRRAQYMMVKEFAEKYNFNYDFTRKEVRSIWAIVTAEAKCEPIPVIAADKLAEWINADSRGHKGFNHYINFYNMKNHSVLDGIFEAYNFVSISLLISSNTNLEYINKLKKVKLFDIAHELAYVWGIVDGKNSDNFKENKDELLAAFESILCEV